MIGVWGPGDNRCLKRWGGVEGRASDRRETYGAGWEKMDEGDSILREGVG